MKYVLSYKFAGGNGGAGLSEMLDCGLILIGVGKKIMIMEKGKVAVRQGSYFQHIVICSTGVCSSQIAKNNENKTF